MNPYRRLNKILPILSVVAATAPAAAQSNSKPNVILILADDMGYSGITPFGGIKLETPALDWLASEGVVCTNFHTNAPVSSPTRVSILTGSYQQRVGLNNIYPAMDPMDGLDPVAHPSFAKQLKEAGYHTGIFGKWHLGLDKSFNPTKNGFDEFRGFLIGNIDMISHRTRMNEVDWWHNMELYEEEGYATYLYNKYAVQFIRDCQGEPFFLYVPHGAIHVPIQGPNDPPVRDGVNPPIYDNALNMPVEEYQRRYREMVKSIDDGLQMILDELKKEGILDNTLIIFTSDNGAEKTAVEKYPGANGFFHGWKSTLYEGGIRVPAIFYYPKSMRHRTNDDLMLTMDLMPTILEFCGIKNNRKIDGISLLPALIDNESMPERDIFWANAGSIAMQGGVWKLVWQYNSVELFNMMIDPKEEHDLSGTSPERTENMKAAAEKWWKEVTAGTKLEDTPPVSMNRLMNQRPSVE
jgi:arylsulfatase A